MSCDRYDKLINLYIDGRLNQNQKRKLKEHLSRCERCQEKLLFLQAVEQKAKGVEAKEPPEEYWETFSERVREKIVTQQKKPAVFNLRELMDSIFSFTPLKVKVAAGVISVVLVFLVGKLFVDYQGGQILPSRETTETTKPSKLNITETETEEELLPAEIAKEEKKDVEKPKTAKEGVVDRHEEVTPVKKRAEEDAVAQRNKEIPSIAKVTEDQTASAPAAPAVQIPVPVEEEKPAVVPESKSAGAGADQEGEKRKAHEPETMIISVPIVGDTLQTKKTRDVVATLVDLRNPQIPSQTAAYELSDITIPKIKETDTTVQADTLKRVIQVWKTFIQKHPADSLSQEGYLQLSNAYYLLAIASQDTSVISEGSKLIEQYINQAQDSAIKNDLSRKLKQIQALRQK